MIASSAPSAIVTGASGFIGSHLSDHLLGMGWRVLGIDSLIDNYDPRLKMSNLSRLLQRPGFEFVESDVRDLSPAVIRRRGEYVFHLAGRPGVRPSFGPQLPLYVRDNVFATERLLAACLGQVRRVIFASSSSVYGDCGRTPASEDTPLRPESPYAMTKVAAEDACTRYRRAGLSVVSLRLFTVYGPGQRPDMAVARFMRAMAAGRPVEILGDGCQSREFTFIDDVIAGMVLAARTDTVSETYNLGGGDVSTVNDLVDEIARVAGRPVEAVYRRAHPGDVRHTRANIDLAQRELGYRPSVPLRDGLRRQFEAIEMTSPIKGHERKGKKHACLEAA